MGLDAYNYMYVYNYVMTVMTTLIALINCSTDCLK